MNDDADLLNVYIESRSEAAFTQLVNRHIGLVHATAVRRVGGDAHLANDVTQVVFTDLARKAGSLRGRTTVSGWLYLATQMASAAVVRRERRRKNREAAALAMPLPDFPTSPSVDVAQLRPVLDDVIVELKADDREAILLRFFQQRSFPEIGAALRITEEAARKRVDRALDKLHDALVRRGITCTALALGPALTAASSSSVPVGLATQISNAALLHASVTATTSIAASLASASLPALAVVVIGAFAIVPQYRANQAIAAEIAQLNSQNTAISALRVQNEQLARSVANARGLQRTAADVPRLQAVLATLPPRPVAPATESILITTQGTIRWEGKPVTLDEFVQRIASLHTTAPGGESQLRISANGVNYHQMLYALDEARKAGIKHIVVESDTVPDPQSPESWF